MQTIETNNFILSLEEDQDGRMNITGVDKHNDQTLHTLNTRGTLKAWKTLQGAVTNGLMDRSSLSTVVEYLDAKHLQPRIYCNE